MAAATSLTPEQRTQRASIAALTRWSREDTREGTRAARHAFRERFRREVDDGTLSEAEIERRAEAALRAHMARLAYASSKARSA